MRKGRARPCRPGCPDCMHRTTPPALSCPALSGCPESSEDAPGTGPESPPAQVSLEEALVRLAEFLSEHLEAEEGCRNASDLNKVCVCGGPIASPPCVMSKLTLASATAQRPAPAADCHRPAFGPVGLDPEPSREAAAASPRVTDPHSHCGWYVVMNSLLEGCTSNAPCDARLTLPTRPTPGRLAQEDSPRPCRSRDEAQEQLALQVEQEQRARQRLEELILGQVRRQQACTGARQMRDSRPRSPSVPFLAPTAGRAEAAAGRAGGRAGPVAPGHGDSLGTAA